MRKTDVDEETVRYLQLVYHFITLDSKWWYDEDTTLNVLKLCYKIMFSTSILRITDIIVVKRRKILGSAKLLLQRVKKQNGIMRILLNY